MSYLHRWQALMKSGCFRGGHHASRSCAESRACIAGITLLRWRLSAGAEGEGRACAGDDDESIRHARRFLAACSPKPIRRSAPDRVHVWSSFAHAAVMAVQGSLHWIARSELIGSVVLIIIGIALIALSPPKQSNERTVAVGV